MDEQRFQTFILGCKWVWAKTFQATAPHEYTMLFDCADKETFFDLVRAIQVCGFKVMFWGKPYQYLIIGNYYFFTGYSRQVDVSEVKLINRCSLKEYSLIDGQWIRSRHGESTI